MNIISNRLEPSTPIEDANTRTLYRLCRDVITDADGDLVLSNPVLDGLELVFRDGALLWPGDDYTIEGSTVKLVAPATTGEKFVVKYFFRAQGG